MYVYIYIYIYFMFCYIQSITCIFVGLWLVTYFRSSKYDFDLTYKTCLHSLPQSYAPCITNLYPIAKGRYRWDHDSVMSSATATHWLRNHMDYRAALILEDALETWKTPWRVWKSGAWWREIWGMVTMEKMDFSRRNVFFLGIRAI